VGIAGEELETMVISPAKRIAISGYYGFNNSGDEAVLQSILHALQAEGEAQGVRVEPVVLSANPEWTERMYGVRAVHRMKLGAVAAELRNCDGLISGGGSLLQDATGALTIPYYLAILQLAQWLGKPTFIYAQGIGPVYRRMYDPFIRTIFMKCRYISVRDQESADLLQRMGVPGARIDVVPDPVMGLKLRQSVWDAASLADSAVASAGVGDAPVIGISVRYWNKDRAELKALADILREVRAAREVILRFLPFHLPSDEEASRYVMDLLGVSSAESSQVQLVSGVTHPQDMIAEVSSCSVLIGMRLHSLIYAASQSVPLLGLSYDPKIDQFLHRLDMRASAWTSAEGLEFPASQVLHELLGLLQKPDDWKSAKQESIERLKQEAHRPAQQIIAVLRSKG
jgi:polysaccharide pyruvyl transferase CsaB